MVNDIFQSRKSKHFFSHVNYLNDLELLDTLISLFSLTELQTKLTAEERTALRFYLKHGYSPKTKDQVKKDIGIKAEHLNQINFRLDKKGFLQKHPRNHRLKLVNPRLLDLKARFLSQHDDSKATFMTIYFERKKDSL